MRDMWPVREHRTFGVLTGLSPVVVGSASIWSARSRHGASVQNEEGDTIMRVFILNTLTSAKAVA